MIWLSGTVSGRLLTEYQDPASPDLHSGWNLELSHVESGRAKISVHYRQTSNEGQNRIVYLIIKLLVIMVLYGGGRDLIDSWVIVYLTGVFNRRGGTLAVILQRIQNMFKITLDIICCC